MPQETADSLALLDEAGERFPVPVQFLVSACFPYAGLCALGFHRHKSHAIHSPNKQTRLTYSTIPIRLRTGLEMVIFSGPTVTKADAKTLDCKSRTLKPHGFLSLLSVENT